MDNFALWREGRRTQQQRVGKTLVINWPLWQNGGMGVNAQMEHWFIHTVGMQPLSTETGLAAFSQGLAWKAQTQFLVIEGTRSKINKWLGLETVAAPSETTPSQLDSATIRQLLAQVQQGLVEMAAAILKLETQTIDLYEHISEYGFNSIAFIEYANQLNDKYQLEITPAIFFEYPSINALSQFMLDKYQPRFLDYYQNQVVATDLSTTAPESIDCPHDND